MWYYSYTGFAKWPIALISPVRYNINNAIFLLYFETGVAIMTKDSMLSKIWLLPATNLYLMKFIEMYVWRKQESSANEIKSKKSHWRKWHITNEMTAYLSSFIYVIWNICIDEYYDKKILQLCRTREQCCVCGIVLGSVTHTKLIQTFVYTKKNHLQGWVKTFQAHTLSPNSSYEFSTAKTKMT